MTIYVREPTTLIIPSNLTDESTDILIVLNFKTIDRIKECSAGYYIQICYDEFNAVTIGLSPNKKSAVGRYNAIVRLINSALDGYIDD